MLQPSKNGCKISIRKDDSFMPNSLLTGHLWTGLVSYSLMNLGSLLEKAVVFGFGVREALDMMSETSD